jgi:hypothetical protein
MLLPARAPARSAAAAQRLPQRQNVLMRLMVDLGLLLRLAFLVAEGLLAVRAVLVLLGGNPTADFSTFVYSTTGPLVAPFSNVFQGALTLGGQALDATAVLAIVVYWILARLLQSTLRTFARL